MHPREQPAREKTAGAASQEAWQAEKLRLTAFLTSPVPEQAWWAAVVGEDPEQLTSNPRTGVRQAQGTFRENNLTLLTRKNRVDWVLSPSKETQIESPGLATVGALSEVLSPFVELMRRWLELSPPMRRLALGAVAFYSVPDRRTGFREIAKYLPAVQLDPEETADFEYHINRRRRSSTAVEGLSINRLCKWSVVQFVVSSVMVEPDLLPEAMSVDKGPTVDAIRLETDMNTVPEFQGVLPKEQLRNLLYELMHLTLEIAQKGDIR